MAKIAVLSSQNGKQTAEKNSKDKNFVKSQN